MAVSLGPWLFASVALVLVGALAYRLGALSRRASEPRRESTFAAPADPLDAAPSAQSATAAMPPTGTPLNPGAASAPEAGKPPLRTGSDNVAVHTKDEVTATLQAALTCTGPADLRIYAPGPNVGGWRWVAGRPAPPAEPVAPYSGLPSAVVEGITRLSPGEQLRLDGWRIERVGEGPAERLVVQAQPAEPTPSDDAASFSFTVSHDLRAPVRVVEGFARILKEDYGRQIDRIGNDHLDRVLGAAARMNSMIDAMLSLARLSAQPLARQPVDLSRLGEYIVEDLRKMSPSREVVVSIEPGMQAQGDPTLLRQVLENLLANAWKYTGKVDAPRIGLRVLQQGGERVFEIADNGAGFDMRSADRLFGLFQRLHSAKDFPGTGVGLASVQRIVRRHGGRIWADSAPGEGARFFFTLPG